MMSDVFALVATSFLRRFSERIHRIRKKCRKTIKASAITRAELERCDCLSKNTRMLDKRACCKPLHHNTHL